MSYMEEREREGKDLNKQKGYDVETRLGVSRTKSLTPIVASHRPFSHADDDGVVDDNDNNDDDDVDDGDGDDDDMWPSPFELKIHESLAI